MKTSFQFRDYAQEKEDRHFRNVCLAFCAAFLLTLVLFLVVGIARAEGIDTERLATAIYHAEGGAKTRHPYGILAHYKHTTPRQACINTIKSALRRYGKVDKRLDFITFLGQTYCPVGAKNDPTGLNKNWVRNVRRIYEQNI